MLCFFCRRWHKSQSAHLPGHVEEQGSSMDKFIAWKSSGDTTAGWDNHSQPKWFKPGARTTLSPFGQRNSGPLVVQAWCKDNLLAWCKDNKNGSSLVQGQL